MISQDRDYEDSLRQALRAAAEAVEPAGDGLERIRHRLHSPRSASATLAGTAEWLRLLKIRLTVRFESFRYVSFSDRGHTGRRRSGQRQSGEAGQHSRASRLGPAAAWLKPAFAVAAVVAVVAVGVFALQGMQQAIITPTNSVTSPGQHHPAAAAASIATPGLWHLPLGVQTRQAVSGKSRKRGAVSALPAVACTPTPTPSSTPEATASATATATPTPTDTSSATPTPTATDSGTASATPTTSTGTGTASATADVAMTAAAAAADSASAVVGCGSTATPKASHTAS